MERAKLLRHFKNSANSLLELVIWTAAAASCNHRYPVKASKISSNIIPSDSDISNSQDLTLGLIGDPRYAVSHMPDLAWVSKSTARLSLAV